MERIYLLWWALFVGVGLTGILQASFELKRQRAVTRKVIASLAAVVLVVGAGLACPAMLEFEYNGVTNNESLYGLSWMLLASGASTLVLAFRSPSAKRARRYLDSRDRHGG